MSGNDTLLLKTFGETSAKLQRCNNIVQLTAKTIDGMEIYVCTYVVPTICAPISKQIIHFTQKACPHLLELADSTQSSADLVFDLLVGADYYWHFVSGEVIRDGTVGPVANSTRLGYMLSGPVAVPNHQESTVNLTETIH